MISHACMYMCCVGIYACLLYIASFVFIYPVLNELFNLRHILTAEECSEVAKAIYDVEKMDKLVLVLSVKPAGAVEEAEEVMKVYHFNTLQLHGKLIV